MVYMFRHLPGGSTLGRSLLSPTASCFIMLFLFNIFMMPVLIQKTNVMKHYHGS